MSVKLRNWQQEALSKALDWLVNRRQDSKFLINAAPGSGKTITACAIAQYLIEYGEIERVVVIAPRQEVVQQWARDFKYITKREMIKVNNPGEIGEFELDICATWQAVQGLADAFHELCRQSKTLVICDEHHHAAVRAAWGEGANGAFAEARFSIILTGTPIRSDKQSSIWLAYDDAGKIIHPEEGTYTLTYGDAVDLGYCRPVTFHRHEGKFTVSLSDSQTVQVSGHESPQVPDEFKGLPELQRVLDFYRLACTPQYEDDGITPMIEGYQGSMIQWATSKLDEIRCRMPEAGGLVIAPSIEVANYMQKLLEYVDGEKPSIVHTQEPGSENKIKGFRNSNKRWMVSVAMISEGVDIKRLRVLVYLSKSLTELSFRQAVGRIVRTIGPDDDSRAYVVMPSFETLESYARKVEAEMSPSVRSEGNKPTSKKCPICAEENALAAKSCTECGHEFGQQKKESFKECFSCGGLNPKGATSCQHCGVTFEESYTITLDQALRTGAIVRGMELDEEEVREGEKTAEELTSRALREGDAKVVEMLTYMRKHFPDEGWSRIVGLLRSMDDNSEH